ncbi:hypothetical protein [Pseudoalteromonas maricaloris]|uniref:hypothetical protein n=1 Tax=Pseudoalteromonas maricaloris TaxID=184924 RepID=UPI00029A03A2|nr:hypothetical protein [Pseudoalteromonas flavipulchra]
MKCYIKIKLDHGAEKSASRSHSAGMSDPAVRWLTLEERQGLRTDMAESSAWAKAELKRRRDAKNQKNSAYGIDDGIEKGGISN